MISLDDEQNKKYFRYTKEILFTRKPEFNHKYLY